MRNGKSHFAVCADYARAPIMGNENRSGEINFGERKPDLQEILEQAAERLRWQQPRPCESVARDPRPKTEPYIDRTKQSA